ncbi:MAG: hypothetical protein AABW81_02465 [Nanoarchaeota archaeon]
MIKNDKEKVKADKRDLIRLPSIKETLHLRKEIYPIFEINFGNYDGEGNLIRGNLEYRAAILKNKFSFENIIDVSGTNIPNGIMRTNEYLLEHAEKYFLKNLNNDEIIVLDPKSIDSVDSGAHGKLNSYDRVCSGSFYIAKIKR